MSSQSFVNNANLVNVAPFEGEYKKRIVPDFVSLSQLVARGGL